LPTGVHLPRDGNIYDATRGGADAWPGGLFTGVRGIGILGS